MINYNLIYTEMLATQFPNKLGTPQAQRFLQTDKKAIDIINFNQFISNENETANKRYISYDEPSILEILTYQDENKLNSTQVAKLFNISRITLRKWKKHFSCQLSVKKLFVRKVCHFDEGEIALVTQVSKSLANEISPSSK